MRPMAAAAILAGFALGPALGSAQQQTSWDGTWAGGWESGQGTQLILAGDDLIAVYWHGDYIDQVHSGLVPGGAGLAITWPSVEALLTRDGDSSAHLVIHEMCQPDVTISLMRDH